MKRSKAILITILGILTSIVSFAQNQTVKGIILDAQAEYALIGATIQLVGSDPIQGAVADVNGEFRIENVPVGRQTFAVTYIGYKSITLPNVLVTSGKEVILRVLLEESVEKLEEVVVTASADKDLPINDLAKVSARTFSLEEVTRFSGGRNDVAKLATSFAGVNATNDARNDIVVRGNSPIGLLWRIEGIPIATTNHFATQGTTGGPVNALNTNLLRTSDFLTGAFPAEYGNANAAVFDVFFRNGNTDKFEFTGQMSAFSGLEFMAEGPISKKNNSSFVTSYRYGIASLAATGTSAIPYYQDLSFKANLGDTKIGRFELFGLGGKSSIDFLGDEIDENDLFADPSQDAFVENELGLIGLAHTLRLSQNTYLKTSFGASTNYNQYEQDNRMLDANDELIGKYRATNVRNRENRYTATTTLNTKFNARWSMRAGILNEIYDLKFFVEDRDDRVSIPDNNNDGVPDYFLTSTDVDESYSLLQTYGQAEYKLTDNLSTTFGLHAQYHEFMDDFILEPRAAISWQQTPIQRWSIAYGLHGQAIPAPILFYQEEVSPGTTERTNDNLGFMKAHHFVLGMDRNLAPDWRLKTEVYYQKVFDVPVEQTPSSYSVLNEGNDFIFEEKGSLVNDGTGFNYGVEATLEKFFSRNYYMLLTTSIFDSQYEGSDGIQRNTVFNNNYVLNVLFGKEWKFGANKQNAWTFDTKLTTSGGRPYTPIDLTATRDNLGREVRMEDVAFSQRYDEYFRWDMKVGVRLNRPKVSHQFFVDFQNVTNRKNEFIRRYNPVTDRINVVEQIGFFPDLMYRIQF
ncbi:MAG: carboxypeptidase-like regulatory domain-containing protein [Ekhidna sp.]|uniref:TonB-dependent receptor n=1 Tax=Ekhidna sp. TaxID=2608089 RepID=UPI0032EF22C1